MEKLGYLNAVLYPEGESDFHGQANSNMAECLFSSAEKPGPMAEQVDESH